jgi:hypothetical protein
MEGPAASEEAGPSAASAGPAANQDMNGTYQDCLRYRHTSLAQA